MRERDTTADLVLAVAETAWWLGDRIRQAGRLIELAGEAVGEAGHTALDALHRHREGGS